MTWSYVVLAVLLFVSPWVTSLQEFTEHCRRDKQCVCFGAVLKNEDFAAKPKPYDCETLTFINSTLPTIPGNTFLVAAEVQEAYFVQAEIRHLRKSDFRGAVKLRKLDLEANLIRELNNETFTYAVELSFLKLSFNKINRVEQNAFHNLENLEELYLNGNAIKFLPSNLFDHMHLLRVLELQNNQIQALPELFFQYNLNVEALNLGNNQLKIVHQDGRALLRQETSFGFLRPLVNLQKLSLSGNEAVLVPRAAFQSLSKLRELDLSRLEIIDIEYDAFKNLLQLTHLDLGYNDLRDADVLLFSSLENLRTLSLRGNILFDIDIQAFLTDLNSTRIDLMKNVFSCSVVEHIKHVIAEENRSLQDFMSPWEEEAEFGEDCAETSGISEISARKDTAKGCESLKAVSLQLENQQRDSEDQFEFLRQKLESMEATLDRIYKEVKLKPIFV